MSDDLDDREWPDSEDLDEDDEFSPCPYCGELIYADAERCPSCERYLSREDAPRNHPSWIVLGFLLCLIVVMTWIFGR